MIRRIANLWALAAAAAMSLGAGVRVSEVKRQALAAERARTPIETIGRRGGSGAWRRGGRLHEAALRAWHKRVGVERVRT